MMIFYYFITYLFITSATYAITLQEAYNSAGPNNEYEKYVILEPNEIYTGGLGIFEGDVFIDCNESIINLQGGNGIWVYSDEQYPSSLHIEHCTITNGIYYGLSFGGNAYGEVINCNLIETNFGLKLFDESNVIVTNSIFSLNQTYGIGIYTEIPTLDISHSLFWNNVESDCMENCPGWGGIWTQFELNEDIGIIYENPLFENYGDWNFSLLENSPCIDSGNPEFIDTDGSISDIGAIIFNQSNCNNLGDINNDGIVNVLDIVEVVGCVLDNPCPDCADVNEDGQLNILDIVAIVNIIID